MAPIMVVGGLGVGIIQLQLSRHFTKSYTKTLIILSGLVLFITMLLGLSYGMRLWLGASFSMREMINYHGLPNAFAFAIPGLLAWNLETDTDTLQPTETED